MLLPAGGAGAQDGPPPESAGRLEGEYGLWVQETDDSLRVGWITGELDAGRLRVLDGERVLHEVRTPPARAHSVGVARPRSARIVLEYGGSGAELHRTAIRLGPVRRAPSTVARADSIFVLGDVHGEFDNLRQLLANAGVLDERMQWRAGRSHLVLLGDLMDRGPDVVRTLWFLYDLERQAEQSGGRVHVLLGNHEIMVFAGDLRYVSPKETALAQLHGVPYPRLFDVRQSVLGRWLASKPALLRIGRALFAHGGVTPRQLPYTVGSFNDSLYKFIGADPIHDRERAAEAADSAVMERRDDFFWGEESVFWHRGYARTDTLGGDLARVLRRFGSDVLVIGHTPQDRIQQRYGGRVIAAHPPRPAYELLLLVRERRALRGFRYGLLGPPLPLDAPPPSGMQPGPAAAARDTPGVGSGLPSGAGARRLGRAQKSFPTPPAEGEWSTRPR